ncbi:DUF72 domain-containing protein [Piscinibacter koreensis]|uniref:DUF72 domain-containing protein n=1 Tax=Piscinibacter koreensis TaxID=2742824 RepID=A0A7Y6NKM4_9BURK|nr:DUF72 domain-containing protein [Schlegelella koreensis]NUZ04844.1 DUF72 domain-containing protein [Schlegelella koreensis]
MAHGELRIGISGWRYPPWRGVFYPPGLAQHRELTFASRMLPTIEVNGSFYSLQRPELYAAWHDETPDDFVFALKGSRYITHMLKLNNVRVALAKFFASGVFRLRGKLGPILWQFPPQLAFNPDRFDTFFDLLPRDTAAARELAREHDGRLEGRAELSIDRRRRLRHAVEIRHPSFVDPAFIALLRKHGIALVVADTAGRWPLIEDLTADFVYVRLHGDKELYASGYGDDALNRWAARMAAWRDGTQVPDARLASPLKVRRRGGRDVFCYFDNDVKVHAPYDAGRLAARLGVPTGMNAIGHFVPPPGLVGPRASWPALGRAA